MNKLKDNFKPVFDAVDAALFGTDKTTTAAPHIVDHLDIKRYMSFVILALVPSVVASVIFFGLRVLFMIAVSYAVGGTIEVIFAIVRKKEIHEGFFVTGLIFPLVLPPTTPLWVVAVGIAFGIFFGKEVFGGTGRNIFNPALVGRLFITIAFPAIMTAFWRVPFTDAITTATPLTTYKSEHTLTPYMDLILGAETAVERHAVMWCIENLVPLRQMAHYDWIFCTYEMLCQQPEVEAGRILSQLRMHQNWLTRRAVRQVSSVARADSAVVGQEDLLRSWQNKMETADIDTVLRLVDTFGIRLYTADPLPHLVWIGPPELTTV